MFRGGILIAIICGALALAVVLAMPRVSPQQPVTTTVDIKSG
jgi:hypothetical protein